MTEGITALTKTELPRYILIAELIKEAASKLAMVGEPTHVSGFVVSIDAAISQKLSVLEKLAKDAVRPSTRAGLTWIQTLLVGNPDGVLKEMVHQNMKTKIPSELLIFPKLGWKDSIQTKLDLEAEDAQKRALKQVVHPDDENLGPLVEQLSRDLNGEGPDAEVAGEAQPTPILDEKKSAESDEDEATVVPSVEEVRRIHVKTLFKQ